MLHVTATSLRRAPVARLSQFRRKALLASIGPSSPPHRHSCLDASIRRPRPLLRLLMAPLAEALNLLSQLENTLQDASNSPDTQSVKRTIRTRLDRLADSLPRAAPPPPRRVPERSSSEPPHPAQPQPRPPPPVKLSKKEAKTARCRNRAESIVKKSLELNPLTSDDFFTYLAAPFRGDKTEAEDLATCKLFLGYTAGSLQSWRESRGMVDFNTISIQKLLQEELEYVTVPDLSARILLRHRNLSFQENTADISNFIRELFQTVNAIQFSIEMEKLGSGTGGTTRKTALYRQMYEAEGSPGTYPRWKESNEAKVTARNKLSKVYTAFGPIMLFDSFWSPRNLEPNHRTNDFGETLTELIHSLDGVDISPKDYYTSTKQALSNLLTLIFPGAATHVLAFCDVHPPQFLQMEADEDSD
ncbi:hypothetical protein FB451DRAFT_1217924 [Mycena latifolia]|nr:hypothetical protein FB451DRAFT_1217924 [Mycena latifolia]